MTCPPVPYDPELTPGLAAFLALVEKIPLRADTILANRAHFATIIPPLDEQIRGRQVSVFDHTVNAQVDLTIVGPHELRPNAPALYHIHGGGMILGTRFFGLDRLIDDVLRFAAVGVSVEYRLAPENPAPAAVEDCYAGLRWLAANAGELGVDASRIVVGGFSAGGGLAAGTSLLARDRGGPPIAGQMLMCPMLDDRNDTVSARQYDGIGAWDRNNNETAWTAVLGGADQASPYAAPARMPDLSGLPPAYVDVGAAETFRDEAVEYARRIWAAGGQAELHVWAGGYHGFTGFSPNAAVSRAAEATRLTWLRRILR
ncbi:alpha/beta hydrolase [Fodinicola acaciae]|uniref:alpha/beta hydrolase n=1 Tax=Fodinicola acaciae TaxID=2681555 RepID=UPI0013D57D71|nr:alpha/beta hydrolase [Fodinicola acaciae]